MQAFCFLDAIDIVLEHPTRHQMKMELGNIAVSRIFSMDLGQEREFPLISPPPIRAVTIQRNFQQIGSDLNESAEESANLTVTE
jgi:hypothetical protein